MTCPDHEETHESACNAERVCKVRTLLSTPTEHHDEYGPPIESLEEGVIDILADLRHLCDMEGFDFGKLDRMAYEHYTVELTAERSVTGRS